MRHQPLIVFEGGPLDGLDCTDDPMRASFLALVVHRYPAARVEHHVDDDTLCKFAYIWNIPKGVM